MSDRLQDTKPNIAHCMSVWYDGSGSVGYHCLRPAGHRGPCGEGTIAPVAQTEQPTCDHPDCGDASCSGVDCWPAQGKTTAPTPMSELVEGWREFCCDECGEPASMLRRVQGMRDPNHTMLGMACPAHEEALTCR